MTKERSAYAAQREQEARDQLQAMSSRHPNHNQIQTMNGNEPAFPRADEQELGLSKREFFAAHAMAAIISIGPTETGTFETIARAAVMNADALILELSKPLTLTP